MMDDEDLLNGFLDGTLDAFPHRDHVRTAYLLLCSHDFDEATGILSERIRAMAAAGGQPDKFHVTRTVAWMVLVDRATGSGGGSQLRGLLVDASRASSQLAA